MQASEGALDPSMCESYVKSDMRTSATTLYREPDKVFSAADRGETVTIRRGRKEYLLTRKANMGALYGSLRASIRRDTGKPETRWKAAG